MWMRKVYNYIPVEYHLENSDIKNQTILSTSAKLCLIKTCTKIVHLKYFLLLYFNLNYDYVMKKSKYNTYEIH
jgi:hypothetical protein